MSRSFFDTNVLIYMYDDNEPEKKQRAAEVFKRECEADQVTLSTQVLQEFYVIATKRLVSPLTLKRAAMRVRDFSSLPLVQVDTELILAAITRSQDMSFSFCDGLIIESALRGQADTLLTEDLQHGQIIDGMQVENPFL